MEKGTEEQKRDYEDLWKNMFIFGADVDRLETVYEYKWSFANLENALGEGGELHNKNVYLFGFVEQRRVHIEGQDTIKTIPIMLAVVLPFPPFDKFVSHTGPNETVPMEQLSMEWLPYVPLANRKSQAERHGDCKLFILSCTAKRDGCWNLSAEHEEKLKYYAPDFYNPLEDPELRTSVPILFREQNPSNILKIRWIQSCFDWEADDLEHLNYERPFTKLIENDQDFALWHVHYEFEPFKDFVEKKVKAAKQANSEAIEARRKAREELSEEERVAFENLRLLKFYPDTPDHEISHKRPRIFYGFGDAHRLL